MTPKVLGRILMIMKGDYDPAETYEGLDVVRHNGTSWVCKETCQGEEPSDTSAYWQVVAIDGTNGRDGIDGKDGIDGINGIDGKDGVNGNRWFRGTEISGKASAETSYPTSIGYANVNDNYLNPDEGAVYHCSVAGDDNVAKWKYDFTMTGGGGGGSQAWINGVELAGRLTSTDLGIIWTGTHPEFESDKTLIPDGTLLAFTDDYLEPEEATWGKIRGDISNQTDLKQELDTITSAIGGKLPSTDFTNYTNGVVGDGWNKSTAYVQGDYCIKDNTLWLCLKANTNVTPVEGDTWKAVKITSEIKNVNDNLAETNTTLDAKANLYQLSGALTQSVHMFNGSARKLIIASATSAESNGMWIACTSSYGKISYSTIIQGTSLSVTASEGTSAKPVTDPVFTVTRNAGSNNTLTVIDL